jgi:phage regulator Rha-like protein
MITIAKKSANGTANLINTVPMLGINSTMMRMTSREISVLVSKRHDNVKRTIECLINQNVIVQPQIEDEQKTDALGRIRLEQSFAFYGEQGKRDSIITVAQLCPEFTAKLVDRWQELEEQARTERIKTLPTKETSYLPEYRKARSLELTARVTEGMLTRLTNLSQESQQALYASMLNPIIGYEAIPLPILEEKHYTATEIGETLGVSSQKIGRIANENKLKIAEFGKYFLDKSKHSDKQVESFRYNAAGFSALKLIVKGENS